MEEIRWKWKIFKETGRDSSIIEQRNIMDYTKWFENQIKNYTEMNEVKILREDIQLLKKNRDEIKLR